MSDYELYSEHYGLWLTIIALRFIVTIIAYFPLPFLFAKLRKKVITKRKYIFICYALNLIPWIFFIAINGGSNGYPYYLWTWIFSMVGKKKLEEKKLLVTVPPKKERKNKHNKQQTTADIKPSSTTEINIPSDQDVLKESEKEPSNYICPKTDIPESNHATIESNTKLEALIPQHRDIIEENNGHISSAKPKHSKIKIILIILLGVYSLIVSILYFYSRNANIELSNLLLEKELEISNLNQEITTVKKSLSAYKDSNLKYSSQIQSYKTLLNRVSSQKSLSSFYSSKSLLVNPKNETIFITFESPYSYTITSTPSSGSISYGWGDWVDNNTCKLTIYSAPKGISSITISNDINSQKITIVIFVND